MARAAYWENAFQEVELILNIGFSHIWMKTYRLCQLNWDATITDNTFLENSHGPHRIQLARPFSAGSAAYR
jgi:hypothetical protein